MALAAGSLLVTSPVLAGGNGKPQTDETFDKSWCAPGEDYTRNGPNVDTIPYELYVLYRAGGGTKKWNQFINWYMANCSGA
jgi:hypothetical protein